MVNNGEVMKTAKLFIPGTPVAKGRPKFGKYGNGYTPQKTRKYEAYVRNYYKENCNIMFDSAIKIYLTFYMPIPKSSSKKKIAQMIVNEIKHVKRPDTDNMVKGITDAINGLAYKDDSQITTIFANKRYGKLPGIELKIIEDVD